MSNEGPLNKLQAALKAVLEPAESQGLCSGYELADANYIDRHFILKIGIYPWGMTFLEGSISSILTDVRNILKEIQDQRICCPICGTVQPIAPPYNWEPWSCACGVRFYPDNNDNDSLTAPINSLLDTVTPAQAAQTRQRVERGWSLKDLFVGLDAIDNHGTTVYRLLPHATVCSDKQLPWTILLSEALEQLGFSGEQGVYEGLWDNQEILVIFSAYQDDDYFTFDIAWPNSLSWLCSDLSHDNDPNGDLQERRLNDWTDFVYDAAPAVSPPWSLGEYTTDDGDTYWVAAHLADPDYFDNTSLQSMTESLTLLLSIASETAQNTVQQFLHQQSAPH